MEQALHNHRGPICTDSCPAYEAPVHPEEVKLIVDLPDGDCGCRWDAEGNRQITACPGHKALALLRMTTQTQSEALGLI